LLHKTLLTMDRVAFAGGCKRFSTAYDTFSHHLSRAARPKARLAGLIGAPTVDLLVPIFPLRFPRHLNLHRSHVQVAR
jgi:hypothetical protein